MEEPEKNRLSHHFSHEHPLERTSLPPKGNSNTCFGCKLNIFSGKVYYKCKSCPFSLHQVCHNMPKIVQHPADPNHHLILQAVTSSSKSPFKCKACGHQITGFYYNCAKCGDYYHILCSAVPLSIKTPSHVHRLKLEFLPPYDFQCDLCKKPSYHGWLYRCGLCEFDAHLACAITYKGAEWLQHQSVPMYNPSLQKGHELMELITRGMNGLDQSQPRDQDQLSRISEDLTVPSYQFSDACFSIDFAKSLLGDDQHEMEDMPEVKTSTHSYAVLPKGVMDPLKPAKQGLSTLENKEDFGSQYYRDPNPKNGLNFKFSSTAHTWMELGHESQKRKANVRDGTFDTENMKSDTESSRHSCWPRLLFCF
ncbi:uncharacterized protein LOC130790874 [Actinidia eriantha]|uniref:uncharacterized protein LOC130790874 n=1 Tax=Actinidia eriantha TaxID=165200 RepID=UPI00258FFC8F|nr:uncharacterized protein LOC130790874 [Actinidia eriantha]